MLQYVIYSDCIHLHGIRYYLVYGEKNKLRMTGNLNHFGLGSPGSKNNVIVTWEISGPKQFYLWVVISEPDALRRVLFTIVNNIARRTRSAILLTGVPSVSGLYCFNTFASKHFTMPRGYSMARRSESALVIRVGILEPHCAPKTSKSSRQSGRYLVPIKTKDQPKPIQSTGKNGNRQQRSPSHTHTQKAV